MRYSFPSALRLSLVAGTLFCSLPAFSQQAAPPMLPMPPAATPAVSSLIPVPDAGLSPVLLIPTPPGGKLRVEMDARSEDILGMMKSFLKGIGETGERNALLVPGQPVPPPNPMADLLANGNLADILKDVNHVHFAVYELPAPAATIMDAAPAPQKGVKPMPLVTMPPAVSSAPNFDSNAFYENAFSAEGSHRLMFADAGDYKLLMVGFPDRKGYAYAVSGMGYVGVYRTDGYPNLEVLSAFISRATAAAMNSKIVKDAMTKGMSGDKIIAGDKLTGGKLK